MATDVLVLKHQAISAQSAYEIVIVVDGFIPKYSSRHVYDIFRK